MRASTSRLTRPMVLSINISLMIKKPVSPQQPAAPPRQSSWIPPPGDNMKINVDAAVSRAVGFGAVGTICRDASGIFQGASTVFFKNINDPEVLETLAIREAMAIAEDLYIHKIYVASDCKIAVDAIKGGTSASYGAVVHEIIARSSEFRSSNFEAHKLAKHALTLGTGRHVWLGHPGDLLFVPVNVVTIQ